MTTSLLIHEAFQGGPTTTPCRECEQKQTLTLTRHIIPEKMHVNWVGGVKKRSLIAANSLTVLEKYESQGL